MIKYFYFSVLVLFCIPFVKNADNKIDSFFVDWNVATLNSIKLQENTEKNDYAKSLYKNRMEAFKAQIGVQDFSQVNKKSIRYKLLEQYLKEWKGNFYIIEENESGEKVNIWSYVVFPIEKNMSKVFKYKYENQIWKKVGEYKIDYFFEFDKNDYSAKFGEGKNDNDLIVTYIENEKVKNSNYFLVFAMKQFMLSND